MLPRFPGRASTIWCHEAPLSFPGFAVRFALVVAFFRRNHFIRDSPGTRIDNQLPRSKPALRRLSADEGRCRERRTRLWSGPRTFVIDSETPRARYELGENNSRLGRMAHYHDQRYT